MAVQSSDRPSCAATEETSWLWALFAVRRYIKMTSCVFAFVQFLFFQPFNPIRQSFDFELSKSTHSFWHPQFSMCKCRICPYCGLVNPNLSWCQNGRETRHLCNTAQERFFSTNRSVRGFRGMDDTQFMRYCSHDLPEADSLPAATPTPSIPQTGYHARLHGESSTRPTTDHFLNPHSHQPAESHPSQGVHQLMEAAYPAFNSLRRHQAFLPTSRPRMRRPPVHRARRRLPLPEILASSPSDAIPQQRKDSSHIPVIIVTSPSESLPRKRKYNTDKRFGGPDRR